MKKVFLLFLLAAAIGAAYAQQVLPVRFCEQYTERDGAVGLSDIFTPGMITAFAETGRPLMVRTVKVEVNYFNCKTGGFEMYSAMEREVNPREKTIVINDLNIPEAGVYRVFILYNSDKALATGLVEISGG